MVTGPRRCSCECFCSATDTDARRTAAHATMWEYCLCPQLWQSSGSGVEWAAALQQRTSALAAHEWTSNARVERAAWSTSRARVPVCGEAAGEQTDLCVEEGQRKVRRAAASREWHSAATR
jgi:hypothetical protein